MLSCVKELGVILKTKGSQLFVNVYSSDTMWKVYFPNCRQEGQLE